MATRRLVTLEDDTDGSVATETVRFSLDNEQYEIDLSEVNAKTLRGIFQPFIGPARKMTAIKGHKSRSRGSRARSSDVREWAKLRGIAIQPRGRIPAEIMAKYELDMQAKTPEQRANLRLPAQPVILSPEPHEPGPAPEPGEPATEPGEPATEPAQPGPAPEPDRMTAPAVGSNEAIREWALSTGHTVNARGRIPKDVRAEYWAALRDGNGEGES